MSASFRVLVVLLVALGLTAGGYIWGDHARDNAWRAKDAKRQQDEANAREAEFLRGDKASGAYQAELLEARIRTDELTKAFNDYKRRYPILARRAPTPAVAGAGGQPAAPHCDAPPPGDSPALSRGAVWMWNSALFGRDAPEGACGLADTSEGACAVDSGISLEEAWDNQALNARICAEDRIRHQRLIDFLKANN